VLNKRGSIPHGSWGSTIRKRKEGADKKKYILKGMPPGNYFLPLGLPLNYQLSYELING
jgi:hypothetical protein